MKKAESERQRLDRINAAVALLEELKRAGQAMAHTDFAERLGITIQNFQTAKYMRQIVRRLRRHNARFGGKRRPRADAIESGDSTSVRDLREQLRRLAAERESIRLDAEQRIRRLMAKLDRLTAERALEPATFPMVGTWRPPAANDPFVEEEPDGACDVAIAGASRLQQHARMIFPAGFIAVRGRADGGRVDPQFDDPTIPVLELEFEDLDEAVDDARIATAADVLAALEFARGIRGHLLVHSWAGLGRASAIALAIVADRLGPGREPEALASILSIERRAVPNRLVVAHADRILQRGGALLASLDERLGKRDDDRQQRATRRERILARLASLDATTLSITDESESPSSSS